MGASTLEANLFAEKDEVFALVSLLRDSNYVPSSDPTQHTISSASTAHPASTKMSPINPNAALLRLRCIFDKYLECPSLLDPYLEGMIHAMSFPARGIIADLYREYMNELDVGGNVDKNEENVDLKVENDDLNIENIDLNESVTENEGSIQHFIPPDKVRAKVRQLTYLLSSIYALSKVRGHKCIQRLLPQTASDVEPVLWILRGYSEVLYGLNPTMKRDSAFRLNDMCCWLPHDKGTDGGHLKGRGMKTGLMGHFKESLEDILGEKDPEPKLWESIHSLFTWLGIISLVPFDLHTIDSTLENTDIDMPANMSTNNLNSKPERKPATLALSIITICITHLSDTQSTREMAALCLSSLLSRPDLEHVPFVPWASQVLYWYRVGRRLGEISLEEPEEIHLVIGPMSIDQDKPSPMDIQIPLPTESPSSFLVTGILETLAAMFKNGHRSKLSTLLHSNNSNYCVASLWQETIMIAGGNAHGNDFKNPKCSNDSNIRKLLVKLFGRMGCAFLPPRVAEWRYQRGKRSLVENLKLSMESDSLAADHGADEGIDRGTIERKEGSSDTSQKDALFPIPDEVEDAMHHLLDALTDSSTIVRWSAAKGIGRLTERLPAICADDVLDAILSLCYDTNTSHTFHDRVWHGSCLALAELARRGLLLPHRLGEVVPLIEEAIQYDVRRGQRSVGAHVRDAACYTCWAFARAYAPCVVHAYVHRWSVALVVTSLFDREVNCRRAASAAFQENVGRQGADNVKHGIDILTKADYYSLGNRNEAYLSLAVDVAKFKEYRRDIIVHLSGVKLFHWDMEIRILASKSLSRVSKLDPDFCANTVLPKLMGQCKHDDLFVRHGALLGVAEMVLSFGEMGILEGNDVLREERKVSIAELVPSIEKARLYRGRGGEIMRSAACRTIECLSLARIHLTVKQQVRLLDSVDACLVHPSESIQNSAAKALKVLLTNYFPVSSKGPSDRLQNRVVGKYVKIVKTEENPAATRGLALALGHLPSKLLAPSEGVLDSVLSCLCYASEKDCLVGGERDAETRRNAITSLVNVCKTVGIGQNSAKDVSGAGVAPINPMTKDQVYRVFESLLAAMEDYNTDRRGDVGSWSRIAAMKGLETLTYLSIEATLCFPQSSPEIASIPGANDSLILAPSYEERLAYLMTNASAKVKESLSQNIPLVSNPSPDYQMERIMFFDERLCSFILGAMLKQLGEKLDAVRSQAGECLERLLTSNSPRLLFVPCRAMLVKALDLDGREKHWANPTVSFPLLMRAANIDDFLEPILSGVVISAGGLTEGISKSASASLVEWIRGLRSSKAVNKIYRMGEVFLKLFHENKRNARVISPLLSTLDKLLSHRGLDELIGDEGNFLLDLISCLVCEAKGCSNVKRLFAIIGVAMNLIQPHLKSISQMKEKILPFIMKMLLHSYPKVRQFTAESFYIKLTEDGDSLFKNELVEEATQILLNVAWKDEQDTHGHIAEARNRLVDLLGITLTEKERNVRVGKNDTLRAPKDDFQSYASLVNSAN